MLPSPTAAATRFTGLHRTSPQARFPDESPRSVRCDPHAYRRLLHADLRRARRTTLMRDGRVFSIANAVVSRPREVRLSRHRD
jgi:hypothetical protein